MLLAGAVLLSVSSGVLAERERFDATADDPEAYLAWAKSAEAQAFGVQRFSPIAEHSTLRAAQLAARTKKEEQRGR